MVTKNHHPPNNSLSILYGHSAYLHELYALLSRGEIGVCSVYPKREEKGGGPKTTADALGRTFYLQSNFLLHTEQKSFVVIQLVTNAVELKLPFIHNSTLDYYVVKVKVVG